MIHISIYYKINVIIIDLKLILGILNKCKYWPEDFAYISDLPQTITKFLTTLINNNMPHT